MGLYVEYIFMQVVGGGNQVENPLGEPPDWIHSQDKQETEYSIANVASKGSGHIKGTYSDPEFDHLKMYSTPPGT